MTQEQWRKETTARTNELARTGGIPALTVCSAMLQAIIDEDMERFGSMRAILDEFGYFTLYLELLADEMFSN